MGQELKDRVQTLEETMQNFIRRTERAFTRLSISMTDLKNSMDDFKEDMQEYRENSAKEMREFKAEMSAYRDNSAREMQEYRENSAKETQEFKISMEKKWGELANRLGTLAEDVVAPNVVPLAHKYFNCSGQPLDFMVRRKKTHSKDRGLNREFDAFAVFEDTVVLSETKSTPRVEQFVQNKQTNTRGRFFCVAFLVVYIDEGFSTSGNRSINVTGDGAGNPAAFNVFIKGNNPFPKNSSAQYNLVGNVFTENGNVSVGAGSSLQGHIATGGNTVNISGSADAINGLIYAPNAVVSVLGSGTVKGTVVANSLKAEGGYRCAVTFAIPDMSTFTFEFEDS